MDDASAHSYRGEVKPFLFFVLRFHIHLIPDSVRSPQIIWGILLSI
jgi:hypothetical protein